MKKHDEAKVNSVERLIKFIVIGLIAIFVISFGLYMALRNVTTYIARVGDEKISEEEYLIYLEQIKETMIRTAGEDVDPYSFWQTKIDNKPAIEVAKEQALEMAREQKVLLIKAKEADVVLDTEERKSLDENLEAALIQQYGSRSAARKAIEEQTGMTLNEFKKLLIENQIIAKFRSDIISKISENEVTEEEFEDYYNNNIEEFKKSAYRPEGEEAVWARHILIATIDFETEEELPAEELEKVKQEAEEVLEMARNGQDFSELAKEYSQDGNAALGGAYIFTKGVMDPAFEEAAFSLSPGEISDLVKTKFGYHIIKLEEKIPEGQPVSLECAKDYYEYGKDMVIYDKYIQTIDDWKKDYKIEIFDKAYNKIS